MTIQEALRYGRDQLQRHSPTPQLDARLLLAHVLQVNESYLLAHDEQALSAGQEAAYREYVQRARAREPIPYIIGRAPFYGRDFIVNPATLIPRSETEELVQAALRWAAAQDASSLEIADVGTGSGCIAITLALELPQATIWASDISADALAIARQNSQKRLSPAEQTRLAFCQGYLLEPIKAGLDLIVANLPYIADPEWTMLDDGVKWYEPSLALAGGPEGLNLIRPLLQQATAKIKPGGAIFLEIGWRQGQKATQLAKDYFAQADIELIRDLAGHDRIVAVTQI